MKIIQWIHLGQACFSFRLILKMIKCSGGLHEVSKPNHSQTKASKHAVFKIIYNEEYSTKLIETSLVDKIYDSES